jgi:formamidopyrimidine-DNA glycosylase
MPELPEIETISRHLSANIVDSVIKQIIVRAKSLRWPINQQLNKILTNYKITNITRRAKYLLITCRNPKNQSTGNLIIHLGMSGKLTIMPPNTPLQKHDHVDFILNNDSVVRYNDPRRFGMILWTTADPLQHKLLRHLGLEPFAKQCNANYLFNQAQNKRLPIKQFIMDNKIIVGVGNIYANEALFAAKIHPLCPANTLTLIQFKLLLQKIRKILKQAIALGGTTLKDFLDPLGKSGTFVNLLKIYGKAQQSCSCCNTSIEQLKIGQRTTFYCPNCQIII